MQVVFMEFNWEALEIEDAERRGILEVLGRQQACQCPACGLVFMKNGGDHQVMCGCEAKPAGGTMQLGMLAAATLGTHPAVAKLPEGS